MVSVRTSKMKTTAARVKWMAEFLHCLIKLHAT